MIQIKNQFKTKYRIFIQKDIHSIEYKIFNRIIHSKEFKENYSKFQKGPKYGFGALLRPLYGSRTPEMD